MARKPILRPRGASSPDERAEIYRNGVSEAVLADLERHVGRRRSFVKGDPYETAFREGERSFYLMVLALATSDPSVKEPDVVG